MNGGATSPPLDVQFSDTRTEGRISLSNVGIDPFGSIAGVTVIIINITNAGETEIDDTITVTLGAEPLAEKGIRVALYAGEQNFFYSRCQSTATTACAAIGQPWSITVQPRKAKKVYAVTGSRIMSGDSAVVRIAMLDEYNNRDVNYSGTAQVFSSSGIKMWEGSVGQGSGTARVMPIPGMTDSLKVTTSDGLSRWTNPFDIVTTDSMKIWWGDPHTHSVYSGHGRGYITDLLEYAQYGSLLDFVAYTEHDWIDTASFQTATNAINTVHQDNVFAALHGIEWTSRVESPTNGYGHLAVISPNDQPVVKIPVTAQSKPSQIIELAKMHGYHLTVNHPVGRYSFDWNYFDKKVIRNVEMVSDGSLGIPERNNEILASGYAGVGVSELIHQGYQLGFFGVSDNHQAQPGIYSADVTKRSGLTAVLAAGLTRKDLVSAMKARRNYTTTGARILLDVRCGDARMGETVDVQFDEDVKNITIQIHVVGTARLRYVDVMKDGTLFHRFSAIAGNVFDSLFNYRISSLPASFYVRVTQWDGEKAWTSPLWFRKDDILTSAAIERSATEFMVRSADLDGSVIEIAVDLPQPTRLNLSVYDLLGRKVTDIVADQVAAGQSHYYWRKEREDGSPLASGLYLLRLHTEYAHHTQKILILR